MVMRGAGLRTPPNLRVVKAMASPLRARILGLLARGPMSYTEMMRSLRLSPDRDAGRFAYHLKTLVKAGLVRPNSEDGRYEITDLGRIAHSVLEGLEEKVSRRRKMVVRTSRLAIEEFDRSKIVESLVREADVPVELAESIAREAEERLMMMRVRYLTAPLIREVVNAILLEKGLEEYRHKMTRVGMPVYDTSVLLSTSPSGVVRETTCEKVLEEYVLIGVLQRDVADAHLSGSIHIEGLGHWSLGPTNFFHDLRRLFSGELLASWACSAPRTPEDIYDALQMVVLMVSTCSSEVWREQVLPFFNVFLAPFARGLAEREVGKALASFLMALSRPAAAGRRHVITIGLEFSIPAFLSEVEAPGPRGETIACSELEEEAKLIARAVVEALLGIGAPCPSLGLVIHVEPGEVSDDGLLLAAHELAARTGLPVFTGGDGPFAVAFDGSRHGADWTGDWELDILRTGRAGRVVLNLPRAAYEARGSVDRFFSVLDGMLDVAVRASLQRRDSLSKRGEKRLMPILMAQGGGEEYMRSKGISYPIGFVGLPEACLALTEEAPHEGENGLSMAREILGRLKTSLEGCWSQHDLRCVLSASPVGDVARRLAELDVEKYGWAGVKTFGPRERPAYTSGTMLPDGADVDIEERLELEAVLHAGATGGHLLFLTPDEMGMGGLTAEELVEMTLRALRKGVGALAYPAELTYCSACGRAFRGRFPKCPSCGRVSSITRLVRKAGGYVQELGG